MAIFSVYLYITAQSERDVFIKSRYSIHAHVNSLLYFLSVAPTPPPHSCSGFTTPWEPCQDENSRTGEPMLRESITEFSMKLYSHLRESQPSSNLLFSPISIIGALSHLLLGMTKLNCIMFVIILANSKTSHIVN